MYIDRLKTINWDTLIDYVATILVIISSKTVFFGIIHMKKTMLISLLLLLVVMILRKRGLKEKRKLINIYLVFTLLLVIVSMFYIGDIFGEFKSYVGAIILFLEVLAIGMLFVNTIPKERFIVCYVQIMFVISCISLLYFFWSMIDRSSALSGSSVYISGSSRYMALPWYTFGWQIIKTNGYIYDYLFGRNAGPFWEPGAFQGFLFIGLFLLLKYKVLFQRKTLFVIIYLLTIITTQSTTAYIILLISLIGFREVYVDCIFGKNILSSKSKRVQYTIYSIASVALILCLILISRNLANKFDSSNPSFLERITDLKTAVSMLFYNPIAGIGLGKTGVAVANAQTVSATTLLAIGEYFGIPFMIYYAYRFFKGCLALFVPDNQLKKGVLIVSFLLILMSETLYLLPIYAVLLFSTEEWEQTDKST